jgi:hypothetical protein
MATHAVVCVKRAECSSDDARCQALDGSLFSATGTPVGIGMRRNAGTTNGILLSIGLSVNGRCDPDMVVAVRCTVVERSALLFQRVTSPLISLLVVTRF